MVGLSPLLGGGALLTLLQVGGRRGKALLGVVGVFTITI